MYITDEIDTFIRECSKEPITTSKIYINKDEVGADKKLT